MKIIAKMIEFLHFTRHFTMFVWFIYTGMIFSCKEKFAVFMMIDIQYVFDDCRFVILFILMSCFGGCGYYKHKQRLLLMPRDTYVNRGRTSARTTPGLGLMPSHTAAAPHQTEPITLQPSISILPPPYSEVLMSQSFNWFVTSTYQIQIYFNCWYWFATVDNKFLYFHAYIMGEPFNGMGETMTNQNRASWIIVRCSTNWSDRFNCHMHYFFVGG